jgi:hypothetical protein
MSREGAERRPLSFKGYARAADTKRMASQLRLHVLVPLALLGAIGAAFGVYTMGKAPGGGNGSGVPLVTTHPDKTKPKPTPTVDDWAKGLEAWCAGVDAKMSAIEEPQTVADYESVIGEYVQVWDSAQPAFVKLGLPPQKKAAAVELRQNVDTTTAKLRAVFNHMQKLDAEWIKNQFDDVQALDDQRATLIRQLGAGKCLENQGHKGLGHAAIQPAPLLIYAQLERYGKVVVLFYEPGASYDAIQTREARAGALLAHAGFVSVNVSKNREVGQLASQYNVLESPTVLIFTRGLKLQARIEGLYDRTAVLQAVKNA